MSYTSINPATESLRTNSTQDFQTCDLQGVYQGRSLRLKDEGHSGSSELNFGKEIDQSGNPQLDPQKSKGATPRDKSRKAEKDRRENLMDLLPDFEQEIEDFEAFLTYLRRSQRDRNYKGVRGKSEELFSDPTVQHGAVEAAKFILDQEGGDPDLAEYLNKLSDSLMAEKGPQIRAGYNISRQAKKESGVSNDRLGDMREFYRKAIFGFSTPFGLFQFILDSYPGDQPSTPDGQENRLSLAENFLLNCLVADMSSTTPSTDSGFLKSVNDGIRNVEFLRLGLVSCRNLLEKYRSESHGKVLVDAPKFFRTALSKTESDQVSPQDFLNLIEDFRVPPDSLRINFLTQLHGMFHDMPPRAFRSDDNRQKALDCIQVCLDTAIETEFQTDGTDT